jgi:predicted metalloprotease
MTDPDREVERTTIVETGDGGGGGGGAIIGVVLVIVVLAILFYMFGGQLLGTKHTNINVNVSGPAQSG